MPDFDAAKYKQTQHDQWNEDAVAWNRWEPTFKDWFGGVTSTMLELGRISSGNHILDIAAGAGEPALSAAARVGPSGYVLATDLSENIIAFAQQLANERHFHHFETRVMDGENLELPDNSFDIVLCRFGLMYMPDKQRALSEWLRVLKPGGRAVIGAFSTPDKNAWGSMPISVIRKRAQLPPPQPGQPGPFSLGQSGLLEESLKQAGFKNVEIRYLSAPLRMNSAKECIRMERESFGAFNQLMAHLPRQERESIWDEVEESMKSFEGPDGIQVSCEPIIGAGIKP